MKRQKILLVTFLILVLGFMTITSTFAQQGDIQIGDTVEITTTGSNVNLRSGPGTNFGVLVSLPNGTRMTVIDGPEEADGYAWWKLSGFLGEGWAAGSFLQPVENTTDGFNQEAGNSDAPSFIWPLAAPWPAGVTLHAAGDGSGYYPDGWHKGADYYAMDFNGWPKVNDLPVETKDNDLLVLAVSDGCVKKVDEDPTPGYGWNVVITHSGGFQTRYAHLKEEPLVEGPNQSIQDGCDEWVSQGQPIGQIGGTGTPNNSAIHLHFAIYYCANPTSENCTLSAVKPEPMDDISPLADYTKITSRNYSVGYEAILGDAIKSPDALDALFHEAIYNEYKVLGGQEDLFGRANTSVLPFGMGSDMHYQSFAPYALMSTFSTVILEYNGHAFMIPTQIYDKYVQEYPTYGIPVSRTYYSNQLGNDYGWRTDFSNASLFWNWGTNEPVVWNKNNAPWKGSFCPEANVFNCSFITRYDPYIDFQFTDSNNPGPVGGTDGFSATWEATFDENLVSQITLGFELQGHVRFFIDDQPQGDWINSEDAPMSGQTKPTWHVGANTFRILFWQAPGKTARLSLTILEEGRSPDAPIIEGLESDGTLGSITLIPEPLGPYGDFEPPIYPEDGGDTQPPPAPPGGGLGDIIKQLIEALIKMLQDWLAQIGEDIKAWLDGLWQSFQDAIVQAFIDWLNSLCGAPPAAMVLAGGTLSVFRWYKRKRRP